MRETLIIYHIMKDMSLVEHLEELKTRVIRVALIIVVSFIACYGFGAEISAFLLKPLEAVLGGNIYEGQVVFLGVLDKVVSEFQLALWSSVIISSPFWFFQIWLFIKPALHNHEAKVIRPFLFLGFFLFWMGVCFGYFIVFPFSFETLMGFGVKNVTAMISLKEYIILALKVLVVLGTIFQLPNVLIILGFMEIVTKYTLRDARRYVYVVFAVVSAGLTPPDVVTMMTLWVPLVVLYESGVLAVSLIVHPYLKRKHLP